MKIVKKDKIFTINDKWNKSLDIIPSVFSVRTSILFPVCGCTTETLMSTLLIMAIVAARYKLHHWFAANTQSIAAYYATSAISLTVNIARQSATIINRLIYAT